MSSGGKREVWYDHVRKLRKTGRIEIKFMLAAAFASILIGPLGGIAIYCRSLGRNRGR